MSLLDDPTVMRPHSAQRGREPRLIRVRFLPSSEFARDFRLPPCAEGVVTARYDEDGLVMLNISGDGWHATRIPAREVWSFAQDETQAS